MAEPLDAPKKRPPVDMVGTYRLAEPMQKVNPRDGLSYEVPRGEYPVMGLVSGDGKQIQNAGIVFSTPSSNNGSRMDIVEIIRPVDVPAMVQRREIALETNRDNSLKFPLSMFTQTQAPVPEHRLSIARSA